MLMIYYLKIPYQNNIVRFNLIDNGVDMATTQLMMSIFGENYEFQRIKDAFSNISDKITVYGCLVQDDGTETDEFISNEFEGFTKLSQIDYSLTENVYKITLEIPDLTDQRLTYLEEKVAELPPLTSPFTTNLEPTGVATRYYDATELIAIYNNDLPVTVKATMPISYKQPIIIDLNCELYLGGN